MAEKPYSWASGATLEDHSRRKHKILREGTVRNFVREAGYRH